MKNIIDNLKLWLGVNGLWTGISLIISPYLWDVFWRGAREMAHVSVGDKGAVVQLLGIAVIVYSRFIDNKTKGLK